MKLLTVASINLRRALATLTVLVLAAASPVAFADPPTGVARLAFTAGAVSFQPAGDEQWVQAGINRPLIAGDRLWVDNDARAEVQFGTGVARLGEYTAVTVLNLDGGVTQLQLAQGRINLRVRNLFRGGVIEIATPNLAFRANAPGVYRVEVDPQGESTTVFVRDGDGEVYGDQARMHTGRGLAFRFYGNEISGADVWAIPPRDDFDRWAYERDRRDERSVATRYVSPEMIGYADLDAYGTWQPEPTYGNVWFPRGVASDWVPYREGHWAWVDPWGWTWVDDAPWGFAPFHYGRWAYVTGRWGWVPGPANVRPVYAPALVAFVGGPNFQLAVSSGPTVGWFPLAPGEVYRPAYHASREYFREVNVSNTIVNTTVINNIYNNNMNVTNVTYRNLETAPGAITAVPTTVFAQAQPVRSHAMRVQRDQVRRIETTAAAPVAPQAASFTGAAPAARSRPPQGVLERRTVATVSPAPAQVPVDQRLRELQRQPGSPSPDATPRQQAAPVSRGADVAGAPGAARRERSASANVRVVNTQEAQAVPARPAAASAPEMRSGRTPRTDANVGAGAVPLPGPQPSSPPVATPQRVTPDTSQTSGRGREPGRPEDRAAQAPATPAAVQSPAMPPVASPPAQTPASAAPRTMEGNRRGRDEARREVQATPQPAMLPAPAPAAPAQLQRAPQAQAQTPVAQPSQPRRAPQAQPQVAQPVQPPRAPQAVLPTMPPGSSSAEAPRQPRGAQPASASPSAAAPATNTPPPQGRQPDASSRGRGNEPDQDKDKEGRSTRH